MAVIEVKQGVLSVGSIHWERRLFDELIPIPDGTSYNSFLIIGSEKTALIDTVDPEKTRELLENLRKTGAKVDYVISNHAEQDHSGSIPAVLEKFPNAKVVTNAKCKGMLMDHLHIPEEKFLVIKDKEELSLGNKTLRFYMAPWVHWPETMLTYLVEDKILFTCDLFGSHFATSRLYAEEDAKVLEDAKRYYAEIMMPFRVQIRKYLKWIREMNPEIIAPSHGPLWKNPDFIISAYEDWVSDRLVNKVLLPYTSMHGSTRILVDRLINSLMEKGIGVVPFDLAKIDLGRFAIELVDAPTLILAAPTVLVGAHPLAIYAAYLTNALRPKLKFFGFMGSYGWGGKALDHILNQVSSLKVETFEPVMVKGLPGEEDLKKVDSLAEAIAEKHKELNIF